MNDFRDAVRTNNLEAMAAALKAGADPNQRSYKHSTSTVLTSATKNGYVGAMKLLIEAGADVNKCNPGDYQGTALHHANSAEAVRVLVQAGANVDQRDSWGYTPLLDAANYDRDEAVLQQLCDYGANVNAETNYGSTPLHQACIHTNKANVKLLLRAGADPTKKNEYGEVLADRLSSSHVNYESIIALLNQVCATFGSSAAHQME